MSGALTRSEPLSRAYDRWAETYDEEYAERPETATEDALVVSWLRDRLPAGASLIDAGCGTGWLLDRIEWPRALYYGFDISTGMLDRAREKHPGYAFGQQSVVDQWPGYPHDWRTGTPRVALAMWMVLNHLDPEELLLTLGRFASSEGDRLLAVLRMPAAPELAAPGGHDDLAPYVWNHSLDDIETSSEIVGLRVVDHFGFLYGGRTVPVKDAHYLALEIAR